MATDDFRWLRHAFALAEQSVAAGDGPFGAALVGPNGTLVLDAVQARVRTGDATAHAEMSLCRKATTRLDRAALACHTIYSSTEPCPMCAGAIAWSGIGRLVFGVSQARCYEAIAPVRPPRFRVPPSCRDILSNVQPPIAVTGPLLEEEGLCAHALFAAANADREMTGR